MATIRTGNGGFEIDGRVHAYDVGDPAAPGGDHGAADSGDVRVDHTPKDISAGTRATLGQYLSAASRGGHGYAHGARNRFAIDTPPAGDPTDSSIIVPGGSPAPIARTQNSESFVDPVLAAGTAPVPGGDPAAGLTGLSRGKSPAGGVDGHDLLRGVGPRALGPVIGPYTSRVLSANRFTPDGDKSPGSQQVVGGRSVDHAALSAVGASLLLRATGELGSSAQGADPAAAGAALLAAVPSPAQVGIAKVPNAVMWARDALERMAASPSAPAAATISPVGEASWGALNNPEDQWDAVGGTGMVALALAMQAAVVHALEGIASLLSLGNGAPSVPARTPSGAPVPGRHLAAAQSSTPRDAAFALLGVAGTRWPIGQALRAGVTAFFDGTAVKAASAGHAVVVSRAIVRTAQDVAAHVERTAAAFASNPVSGARSVAGIVDVVKRSKLVAAINIFASLGDAILSQADEPRRGPSPGDGRIADRHDAFGPSMRLSWGTSRSPSLYLVPDAVATMAAADRRLGAFMGPLGTQDDVSRSNVVVQSEQSRKQLGARLPGESREQDGLDVASIEAALESEYVPFYFHDLRTNEVVSFHAFLSGLTDDYQVGWETVDAYGRVDPIKIYKGTGRRISLGFHVAALDRRDLDEMWVKLNKLVTLVYPQYTRGRALTDGSGTAFVQPFSQLIGASPVVRLRLGDLLRSNGSRFALARLFGAADGDMSIDGQRIKFEGAGGGLAGGAGATARRLMSRARADSTSEYHLVSAGWASAAPAGAAVGSNGPAVPDQAPSMRIDEGDMQFFKFRITGALPDGTLAVKPHIRAAEELISDGLLPATAAAKVAELASRYANPDRPAQRVVGSGAGYAVPETALRMTGATFNRVLRSVEGVEAAVPGIDALASFLDEGRNALVRSFKATAGKGLAGVIESINIDWHDKVTWEVEVGSRAPRMCKVTMTFVPIHDISPGIDHMGYNRAPVYPVGAAMGPRGRSA